MPSSSFPQAIVKAQCPVQCLVQREHQCNMLGWKHPCQVTACLVWVWVCTYVCVHRIWLLAEDTSYSHRSSHQPTVCQCLWGHHTYRHQILMLLDKKIFFRNQLIQVNSVNGTLWKLLYLRAAPWVWGGGGTWKMAGKQPVAGCWRTEGGHLTVDTWLWFFYLRQVH